MLVGPLALVRSRCEGVGRPPLDLIPCSLEIPSLEWGGVMARLWSLTSLLPVLLSPAGLGVSDIFPNAIRCARWLV